MKKLVFFALVLSLAVSANAAYLQYPTEVIGAVGSPDNQYNSTPLNLINGNGINTGSPFPGHNTTEAPTHHVTTSMTGAPSFGGSRAWEIFILDQARTIDNLHIWNGNCATYQGWKDIEIAVSALGNWTDTVVVYSGTLAQAPAVNGIFGGSDYTGVDLDFAPVLATEISISTTAAWSGSQQILAEVWIHEIPEPATIALLGLGGLALLRKKRS